MCQKVSLFFLARALLICPNVLDYVYSFLSELIPRTSYQIYNFPAWEMSLGIDC